MLVWTPFKAHSNKHYKARLLLMWDPNQNTFAAGDQLIVPHTGHQSSQHKQDLQGRNKAFTISQILQSVLFLLPQEAKPHCSTPTQPPPPDSSGLFKHLVGMSYSCTSSMSINPLPLQQGHSCILSMLINPLPSFLYILRPDCSWY